MPTSLIVLFRFERASVSTVVLGNHVNSQMDPYEVEVEVAQILPHPDYSETTYDSDIMLLKLAAPVEMNEGVAPVCLPPAGQDYDAGRNCYAVGWGVTQCRLQWLLIFTRTTGKLANLMAILTKVVIKFTCSVKQGDKNFPSFNFFRLGNDVKTPEPKFCSSERGRYVDVKTKRV